jgi:replicative DNA helicase
VSSIAPCDIEAEAAVISAVVLEPAVLTRISVLRPEHFYSEAHRRIFEAVLSLTAEKRNVDAVTIVSKLRETNRLEQVGGVAYLTTVLDASPTIHHVEAHAETVHNRYRSRVLAQIGEGLAARARTDIHDPQSVADGAERAVAKLARESFSSKEMSNLDLLKQMVQEILAKSQAEQESAGGRKYGIPYGIPALDKETFGLHATHKTTILGLSGQGKTALAVQVAVNVADQGLTVLFFEVEMTRGELLLRMLALVAMVDSQRLKNGKLTHPEWSRVMSSVDHVGRLPVKIVDREDIHIGHVENVTRSLASKPLRDGDSPLGLVIVDYVQALNAPPGFEMRPKYDQITESTARLKRLAKATRVPLIELAQTKQDEKGSKTHPPKPELFDVSDCKNIIKWSDDALYLWNRGKIDSGGKTVADPSAPTIIGRKQRGGPKFEVELVLDLPTGRFTDPNDPMRAASRDYVSNQTDDEDNELTRGLI